MCVRVRVGSVGGSVVCEEVCVVCEKGWKWCGQCVSHLSQHWVCLQLQPNILVDQLCMQVEPTDSSYMPSSVMVVGGNTYGNLQSIQKTVAIPPTSHNMYLLTNQTEVGGVQVGGIPP